MTVSLLQPVRARDVWMQAACGRFIVTERQIPRQDIFSSTCSGNTWIDHEWLYQTGFYALARNGNVVAAAETVKALLVFLTFAILAFRLRLLGLPHSISLITSGALFWICRPAWTERADLISIAAVSTISRLRLFSPGERATALDLGGRVCALGQSAWRIFILGRLPRTFFLEESLTVQRPVYVLSP